MPVSQGLFGARTRGSGILFTVRTLNVVKKCGRTGPGTVGPVQPREV